MFPFLFAAWAEPPCGQRSVVRVLRVRDEGFLLRIAGEFVAVQFPQCQGADDEDEEQHHQHLDPEGRFLAVLDPSA